MPADDRGALCTAVLWILGLVHVAAATAMWFVPWTGYDSRCSLATRNDAFIRGACADGVAALMPWFVFLAATASVLLLTATIAARGRRRPRAS